MTRNTDNSTFIPFHPFHPDYFILLEKYRIYRYIGDKSTRIKKNEQSENNLDELEERYKHYCINVFGAPD